MPVKVITSTGPREESKTFAKGRVIVVTQTGTLFVALDGRSEATSTLATYAAGQWVSAEVVDAEAQN